MSSSLKKISSSLYGSGDSIASSLFPQQGTGAFKNLLSYYNAYDTTNADKTLDNLEAEALGLSGDLTSYIAGVDGSDTARNETQNAVYQSYLDLLTPRHEEEISDLNTRLLNQGLTIGSEAYQRAMNDLVQEQNQALNQAAYQAVSAGNEVFNDSFDNAYQNAQLANQVRAAELSEIYRLLGETMTEEELKEKIFNLESGMDKTNYQNEASNYQGIKNLLWSASGFF